MARRLGEDHFVSRHLTTAKKPLKRCLTGPDLTDVEPFVKHDASNTINVRERRIPRQRLFHTESLTFETPVGATPNTWRQILRKQRSQGKIESPKQTSRVTFRGLVARLHRCKRKEKAKLCRAPSYPDISDLHLTSPPNVDPGEDMEVDEELQDAGVKASAIQTANSNYVRHIEDIFLVEKQPSGSWMKLRSGSLIQKGKPDNNDNQQKEVKTSSVTYGQTCSKILDFLYLGSIESAYNEPLLCRLQIHMLVDLSNVSASQIPAAKKSICPCPCKPGSHFRSRLNVGIDDIEWENISQHFQDINSFIEGARKNKKNVLVCSYHGKSRAATAVIQYIMRYHHISLDSANSLVKSRRPEVAVNSGFRKALQRLEAELSRESGLPFKNPEEDCRLVLRPRKFRDAWAE